MTMLVALTLMTFHFISDKLKSFSIYSTWSFRFSAFFLRSDPKRAVLAVEEFFHVVSLLTHIGWVCRVATDGLRSSGREHRIIAYHPTDIA